MIPEWILQIIVDNVFGYVLDQSGIAEKIRSKLRPDPVRQAFKRALREASEQFAKQYPEWVASFFDAGFLQKEAMPILARLLLRDGYVEPSELAICWANSLNIKQAHLRTVRVRELEPAVTDFLSYLDHKLKAEPDLGTLFDSRALDQISTNIDAITEAIEIFRHKLESDQATLGTLRDYLQWLIERNLYLDPRGTFQIQRQVQVKLDEVYISLRAQKEEAPDIVDRRLLEQELVELEATLVSGTLSLVEEAEDQRDQLLVRFKSSQVGEVLELSESVKRHDRLVILGDPGSGKTTLLRYLALKHAQALQEARTQVDNELGAVRFPILVRIADYAEYGMVNGKPLTQFLADYCVMHECSKDGLQDLLKGELAKGNCLVLLDGLDEIVNPDDRRKVVQQIEDFVRHHSKQPNHFVITSRIAGYRSASLSEPFAHYIVQDMDDNQILRFLNHWCPAVEAAQTPELSVEMRQIVALREINGIMKSVQNSPGVRRLASNPLLLRTLALIHRTGAQLPQKRIQLYRLASETLAQTWRKTQGVPESVLIKDEYLTPLLSKMAYWLHINKPTGIATKKEVRAVLCEEWANLNDLPWSEDNVHPHIEGEVDKFLLAVREHTGIFVERAPNRYGFMHLTFEEYYTARYLVARSKNRARLLRQYLHDPRWNEPILLALGFVGLESTIEASELLETAILAQGADAKEQGFTASNYEELLGRDFLFALSCLGDHIPVQRRLLTQLIKRLANELLNRTGSACYWPYQQALEERLEYLNGSEGASALASMLLESLSSNKETVCRRAAGYLGQLGLASNEIIPALVGLSHNSTPEVLYRALQSLGRLGKAYPDVVQTLIHSLNSGDKYFVHAAAARSLGRLGQASDDVITALVDALEDEDGLVNEQAAESLGKLASISDKVVPVLLNMIREDNPKLRVGVVMSLGFLDSKQMSREVKTVLLDSLEDEDPEVRSTAVQSLRNLGQSDTEVLVALQEILHDDDIRVKFEVLVSLGILKLAPLPDELVDVLLFTLQSNDDPLVRAKAAKSLGLLGQASDKVVIALIYAMDDTNPDIRSEAIESLRRLGQITSNEIPFLYSALKDRNAQVRYKAVESLIQLGKASPNLSDVLIDILNSPGNDIVRQDAALLLGQIGLNDNRTLQSLWQGLQDKDYNLRIACAKSLAQLGQSDKGTARILEEKLLKAIQDPDFNKLDALFRRSAQEYAYYCLWLLILGSKAEKDL